MKFKTFRDSLTLVTVSFLAIINFCSEAKGATIKFGEWVLNEPIVTESGFASGGGSAQPNTLRANAAVSILIPNPLTWGVATASTKISLENSFEVVAGPKDKVGDIVEGILFGSLEGILSGSGVEVSLSLIDLLTTGFFTSVEASVTAEFQSFNTTDSHSGIILLGTSTKEINVPFNKPGNLIVGNKYPFNMNLSVSALKNGANQASSTFFPSGIRDLFFKADVQLINQDLDLDPDLDPDNLHIIPEPATILGSCLGLGFGALFKKKYSKKQKEAKSLEKQKA
jgi:hypothetical protein